MVNKATIFDSLQAFSAQSARGYSRFELLTDKAVTAENKFLVGGQCRIDRHKIDHSYYSAFMRGYDYVPDTGNQIADA